MPHIVAVQTALPDNFYSQEELIEAFLARWGQRFINPERIARFQRNVLVGGRHLALPMARYHELEGFGAHNDAFIEVAVPLATKAVAGALAAAGLDAAAVALIVSTTVTGIAVPSLEARVMNRLPFASTTRRMPLFGLGCLAGAAGINRAADFLLGHPRAAAVFFSVELCSLTLQKEDLSIANLVASGLFGDGAAAVVMVGDEHPLAQAAPLQVVAARAAFFRDTERVMGWDVVDSGFRVVLAPNVAEVVSEHLPAAVDALCASAALRRDELAFFIGHPGGPKVLRCAAAALGLPDDAFAASWDSLARFGNMSSTSVLFVLADQISAGLPVAADGLLFAFGPAFCAELTLLRSCA
jgi:alkylresorcinol/alkylpyrone synthase